MPVTTPSNLRSLGIVALSVALGIACSDTGSTGSRPTGDTSGTSGTGGPATTGAGVTSGTGTTATGTAAGTTSGTTSTGTTGTAGSTTGTTTSGPAGTTGTSATSTTSGAGGSNGSGGAGGTTGAGGLPGTGGSTGGGDHFGDTSCGAGVTPVGIGRCSNAPKYIVAKGTALTIANFEDPGPNNDHNAIFFGDGRAGNFIDLHTGTTGANITMSVAQTPGVAGASTWALHYVGTATGGTAPMFAIPVADCYDSRAYKGVSFWIKGNPAAGNDHLKFQVHTPVAQPAPSGGCSAADAAAHKCDDHFAVYLPITSAWTKQTVHWADLKQNCPSNIPAGYSPAQYNEMFSFALPKSTAGFDVWLDNFSFDTGDLPTNSLSDIVTEATFNEMWSLAKADGTFTNLRAPFYTYQGMMTAVAGFAGFATTGDAISKRIEAAAFFSNVAHETDSLGLVEEKNCENDHTCMQYPPNAPNGMTYHGRGPIQLTWQTNYSQASSAIGLGTQLVDNPDLVATDPAISWKTGFWFWMGGVSGGGTTPHQAITGNQGLGATIRIINGIECGGANLPAVMDRQRHFRRFSYMFGIDPGATADGC